jgi:hypothetical protein
MPANMPANGASRAPSAATAGTAPTPVGPLHLLKMAVGVADIDELRRMRTARIAQHGGSWVYTRNQPRRAEAVLAGGSIYWVIRGQIRVRQRITGLRGERDDKGRAYCLIEVDPLLTATLWRAWRPFQGWRYLAAADAPPDLPAGTPGDRLAPGMTSGADAALPEHMIAELRALGLW